MSGKSKIEWTDATWNPIRGCSRVSEGCRNCYAERIAARFSGPGQPYEGLAKRVDEYDQKTSQLVYIGQPRWTGDVRLIEDALDAPLHWKKPRRVFVNSMSDLFHEKVLWQWINRIFAVMAACPQHTFQILTKRAKQMQSWTRMVEELVPRGGCTPWLIDWPGKNGEAVTSKWPLPNVWLGVSVEDQATADERIPLLLQTPAAVRFVSYEPALGPVNFNPWFGNIERGADSNTFLTRGIDWLICGGESGPGARPMHPDWARAARDQCAAAGVPFFFKQWGEWLPPLTDGPVLEDGSQVLNASDDPVRVGKRHAGRLLDVREWNEYPTPQLDRGQEASTQTTKGEQ